MSDSVTLAQASYEKLECRPVVTDEATRTRRILHVNVTRHPTVKWTAQQLVEAFPGDGWIPRFLQRDRDGVFGWAFGRKVKALGIEEGVRIVTGGRRQSIIRYRFRYYLLQVCILILSRRRIPPHR